MKRLLYLLISLLVVTGCAGHDAVCLTEQGGQLVRLPQYADSLHLRETETQLVLSADGAADIRIEDDYYYDRYPAIWHLGKKDIRTQQETINRYYFLPQSELTGMSIDSHLQPFEAPMASIHVKAHSRRYANVTNQRLFVSLNPIRKKGSLDIQDNRQHHFYIGQGYANRERLIVQWPEGFDVEAIPEDVVSEVPFGRFSQHVKKEEGKVIVERYLLIRHGIWQELDMEKATDFLHVIEKQYHARMVLRKKL